eukprot:TRINITY_DN13292_c0_g1_i1.p1 TRINITY_DN13292_c0_g1~~TRINITY_DN13292_c0_g1_i1.p1  ORF type:complete len:165 (-),score=13.40 TRINITY_DN13292_c0_g1_i1:21-515(-)
MASSCTAGGRAVANAGAGEATIKIVVSGATLPTSVLARHLMAIPIFARHGTCLSPAPPTFVSMLLTLTNHDAQSIRNSAEMILNDDPENVAFDTSRNPSTFIPNLVRRFKKRSCGRPGCGKRLIVDEIGLDPCPFCRILYYCSETCRSMDWSNRHGPLCCGVLE